MTTEQQRKMLECAAKACGLCHVDYSGMDYDGSGGLVLVNENGCHTRAWNPLANPADTAEMCAEVEIDTAWFEDKVLCAPFVGYKSWAEYKDHDNSRLKAWMFAATIVAAKIGGYTE